MRRRAVTECDLPSRLALAYQAGDRGALPALYEAVRPLIAAALARYRERPGALPAALETSDLAQESWLILADLALRWQPSGGSFAAYLRVSLPWALARYVRRNSPSRRAKGVVVLGAERPEVQEQLDACASDDGRAWPEELAWGEWLEPLTERERAVLWLHLAEQQPFTVVARALGLSRPSAYRLYRRALRRVQGATVRIGGRRVLLDPASLNLERDGALPRLVRALHEGAHRDGQLPGRTWLVRRTGLSEHHIARLLRLLVEAGCVRDRGPRRPGRLTHPSADATLAALGIRPIRSA